MAKTTALKTGQQQRQRAQAAGPGTAALAGTAASAGAITLSHGDQQTLRRAFTTGLNVVNRATSPQTGGRGTQGKRATMAAGARTRA